MKYYKLDLVSDPKIIGVNNGIAQIELDENRYSDKQYLDAINDFFSGIDWWDRDPVPPIEIKFYAKKIKGAILTDFLSFSPFFMACPFIIKKSVYFAIKHLNIAKHYSFPVIIFDKEKILSEDYLLIYMPLIGYEIVDFEKSVFYTYGKNREKVVLSIESPQAFNEKKKDMLISIDTLVFNSNLDSGIDMFYPRLGDFYISERLRMVLEELACSGIRISEPANPSVQII